jgi:hypothetical protein
MILILLANEDTTSISASNDKVVEVHDRFSLSFNHLNVIGTNYTLNKSGSEGTMSGTTSTASSSSLTSGKKLLYIYKR